MSPITEIEAEQQLKELEEEFSHWRQTRTRSSERIPEPLWTKAVALSRVLLNSRVAKALKLSPSALKARRLGTAKPAKTAKTAKAGVIDSPAFVELPRSPSVAMANDIADGISVELERADGSRLRLRCHQRAMIDGLVQRFLTSS